MSVFVQGHEQEKSEFNLAIFVVATLSYNLITLAVNLIVGNFIPNTPVDTALCLLIYLYLLIRAFPTIKERVTGKDFIFISLVVVFLLLSMLIEENFPYIIDSLSIFPNLVLCYFVGRSILNNGYVEKIIFQTIPYMILVCFLLFILFALFVQTQDEDNMSLAYHMLPFSIFSAFRMIKLKENRILNIAVFIVALFLQIWVGTRGPLLCLFVAMTMYVIINPSRVGIKIFYISIMLSVIVLLSSDVFIDIMKDISGYLENIGVSNRIVDKFLEEELLDDSGRGNITEKIFSALKESPLFGYGFFADRAVLNGQYCHNIFYEFLINFGIEFGGILFISLVTILVVSLFRRKENPALFIMLLCVGFVKLFLSSSYIVDPMFFMLLGAALTKPDSKNINK